MDHICNECGEQITMANALVSQRTANGRVFFKHKCKRCQNKQVAVTRRLKQEHTYPEDGKCFCCGRADNLILDHCHVTGDFRGWLCRRCNTGYGLLGDNRIAALQLLLYAFRGCTLGDIRRYVVNFIRQNQ